VQARAAAKAKRARQRRLGHSAIDLALPRRLKRGRQPHRLLRQPPPVRNREDGPAAGLPPAPPGQLSPRRAPRRGLPCPASWLCPRPCTPVTIQHTRTATHLLRAMHEAGYQPPSSTHTASVLLSPSQPAASHEQHSPARTLCSGARAPAALPRWLSFASADQRLDVALATGSLPHPRCSGGQLRL